MNNISFTERYEELRRQRDDHVISKREWLWQLQRLREETTRYFHVIDPALVPHHGDELKLIKVELDLSIDNGFPAAIYREEAALDEDALVVISLDQQHSGAQYYGLKGMKNGDPFSLLSANHRTSKPLTGALLREHDALWYGSVLLIQRRVLMESWGVRP